MNSLFTRVFFNRPEEFKRFEDLKKYFLGLNEDDIAWMHSTEMIKNVEYIDKIRMSVFYTNHLAPYLSVWKNSKKEEKTYVTIELEELERFKKLGINKSG